MNALRPRWVFVSLVVAALAGCGGAAPSASVQAPGASGAATPEAASARFDEAEREVRLALGGAAPEAAQKSVGAPGQPASSAPPAAPPPPAAEAPSDARVGGKTGDACQSACPALSSMRRAATQLCELTGGDGDPRCQSAHDRLKRAEEQVRAHCPSCS